ncbi:MAG: disulfide bond formation protein B [Hafnia sp.]
MRGLLFAVSAVLCGMVGVAVFTQLQLGWEPCVMCVEIRALLLGAAFAFLLAGLIRGGWLRSAVVWVGAAFVGWACWTSGSLFALERGWVQASGCSPFARFPSWMPLQEWFPVLFQPEAICGDAIKAVAGVPLSLWPIIVCVACAVALGNRILRH